MGIPGWEKPPVVICTPLTMVTSTKIPVRVGANTTTATGIQFRNPRRTLRTKGRVIKMQAPVRLRPSNATRVLSAHTKSNIGVPERAMWIEISRTAAGAIFKASALIASSEAEADGVTAIVEVSVGDARI